MPKALDAAREAETTEDNGKREAREGVPQPRRFGLRAGEDAETDLVIVYIGRGEGRPGLDHDRPASA